MALGVPILKHFRVSQNTRSRPIYVCLALKCLLFTDNKWSTFENTDVSVVIEITFTNIFRKIKKWYICKSR